MILARKIYRTFRCLNRYNSLNTKNLPVVKVICSDEEDNIKVSFKYSNSANLYVRAPKEENIQNILARIKLIASLQRKREEIKQAVLNKHANPGHVSVEEPEEEISVCLIENDNFVKENSSNIEAWARASQLRIGDTMYNINYNSPTVLGLNLPDYILSGCSLRPRFRLECANLDDCLFTWYRSQPREAMLKLLQTQGSDGVLIEEDKCWLKISEGFIYTTCNDDVGCFLKLLCTPRRGDYVGNYYSVESSVAVEAAPDRFPFEERHEYTKSLTNENSIRCISYNILANSYVEKRKFPYCSEKARNYHYRKQVLFRELTGYNSDILCLQEVEERVFLYDFLPILKEVGFEGCYKKKGGRRNEGLAIFFRSSKFKLVRNYGILLNSIIYEDIYKELRTKVGGSNKDISLLLKQDTALQVLLLQNISHPQRQILVANTHLYSNKDSPEVRLIQAAVCTNYVEYIVKRKELQSAAVLFCGDFNSLPTSDTFDFMKSGRCSPNWKNSSSSSEDTSLLHNLSLDSACGTPEYTNYTEEFCGCLDYMFFSKDHLQVTEVVPMPKHDEVVSQVALPNEYFPSDHIALVCTFQWKNL